VTPAGENLRATIIANSERSIRISLAGPLAEKRKRAEIAAAKPDEAGWRRHYDPMSWLAFHEAGHAVACRLLGQPVQLISIVPRGIQPGAASAATRLCRRIVTPRREPLTANILPNRWSGYRHAVELYLKVIAHGDGGKFLATRPDELSVHKTRSLSWLAQFVVQIVTTLRWEEEFRTEGVNDLAEFKAVIEETNGIDPAFDAFRCPANPEHPEAVKSTVLEFVRRLDALVELLERTADGLAAEWDLRSDPTAPNTEWPGGKPTIQ
jgi:hypothetical protein